MFGWFKRKAPQTKTPPFEIHFDYTHQLDDLRVKQYRYRKEIMASLADVMAAQAANSQKLGAVLEQMKALKASLDAALANADPATLDAMLAAFGAQGASMDAALAATVQEP